MKKFTLIFTILALVISSAVFTLGCTSDDEEPPPPPPSGGNGNGNGNNSGGTLWGWE